MAGGSTPSDDAAVLVFALACVDAVDSGSTPRLVAALENDATKGTFAQVTWSTEKPGEGRLEFGASEAYGKTLAATDSADGLEHAVRWFGTPPGEVRHWRVVTGELFSEDALFAAPYAPIELPGLTASTTPASTAGFVLTSLLPSPTGALILDESSRPVWWHLSPEGREVMQARLSLDGEAVYVLETSANYLDGDAELVRLPLFGGEETRVSTPNAHHDFRELAGDQFLYLATTTQEMNGATVAGDALMLLPADAAAEPVWSSWGTLPTDTIEPKNLYAGNFVDWTHCNGFDYDAEAGRYWVSAHNLSAIFVVDPAVHKVRWQIGGTHGNVAIEGGGFDQQHSPSLVPGGFLVFDNGIQGAEVPESQVLEFSFDDEEGMATRTWAYADRQGLYATFFGNAERLTSGNTLMSWGGAGRIGEVTPTGEVVRQIDVDLGNAFGFTHALGALAPP